MTGTRTTNLGNLVPLSDEIIVNRAGSTALQKTEDLAAQLAGVGPVAEAIADAKAGALKLNLLQPVRAVATSTLGYDLIVPGAMIDGIAVAAGDRIGLVNSSDPKLNGIVVVNVTGPATRADDADTGVKLLNASFFVDAGATYSGWTLTCVAPAPIILGTSHLPFRKLSDQASINPRLGAIETDIQALNSSVQPTERQSSAIRNQAGFGHLSADDEGVIIGGMEVRRAKVGAAATKYFNRAGFGRLVVDEKGVLLGGMEVRERVDGNVAIRNRAGFGWLAIDKDGLVPVEADEIEAANLPDVTPYFTGPNGALCGVTGVPLTIYVRNLFAQRSDTESVITTLDAGSGLMLPSSSDVIEIADLAALGVSAKLWTRAARASTALRARLSMSVFSAPKFAVGAGPTTNVLCFTDSIGNRQMGAFAKQDLEAWGYQVTFIGTIEGAATTSSTDITGPLGEWREGHETGDMTYAVTDRAIPVAVGAEAEYLALNKQDRRERIPWLRPARLSGDPALNPGNELYPGDTLTPDAPADVRNGYVVDFRFYQHRFDLETPGVILYGYGTNNVRDRSLSDIYAGLLDDDMLILRKMREAWPTAVIIRFCPGTPREPSRDGVWAEYIQIFRAMMDAKIAAANPKLVLAPTWALQNQEIGYATTVTAIDATTGVETVSFSDAIHPIDNTRRELTRVVAGYIACAMNGYF